MKFAQIFGRELDDLISFVVVALAVAAAAALSSTVGFTIVVAAMMLTSIAVAVVGARAVVTVVAAVGLYIAQRPAASLGVGVPVRSVIAMGAMTWSVAATIATESTVAGVLRFGVITVLMGV